ncbi:hypothetical protein NUW54_g11004 [Trametes sanguinea]|uniref:Uncharacterized protein n=1 Tax=Trametes sanguinea TaxID=158606 RepID=A0ACC1NME9_9APHY|nr:hypothetical protein NUW54_g11004 [Trametes sanguinea]
MISASQWQLGTESKLAIADVLVLRSLSSLSVLQHCACLPPSSHHSTPMAYLGYEDPAGHAIAMASFGFIGYWAYHWDLRAEELLKQKRAEIAERRAKAEASSSS